jgi:hypothetical protein
VAWFRAMGVVQVAYHEATVLGREDDHPAQALDRGVAKNTPQRAVASSVRAGVAEPVQERDAQGRFRAGRFRLHVTDLLATAPALRPPLPRPRATRRAAPTQRSLPTPS